MDLDTFDYSLKRIKYIYGEKEAKDVFLLNLNPIVNP